MNNISELNSIIQNCMGILKKIEKGVKKVDFFYAKEMLRYEDEEDYKTLTGGVISLTIIIAIIVGFANMILSTLNLTSISTSTQVIKNLSPTPSSLDINPDTSFRLAVEIWRFNLSDSKRYFDLTFREDLLNNGIVMSTRSIPLEACTKEYFAGYPEMVKGFQNLEASAWMCPPLNTSINLYGKYSSEYASQYVITASACNNLTDPDRPCASPQEIQDLFTAYENYFYFDIYYTNTQINPDEKDYKKDYIEDESYAIFGSSLGSENFLYFTDYTVETDYSIWPYQHIVKDSGVFVENQMVNHPFQTSIDGAYAILCLAKSQNSIIYKREVQKLSAVFSFIGGMIGAVSAVLFILKIYTGLAFEFSIALEIFSPEKHEVNQSKEVKESSSQGSVKNVSMNLWNFIKYYTYSISRMVGKPCDWPAMKYADECKNQISKQLDVKLLLKRIIFIEHCLTHLMEDYQLDALQINKPRMPSQIRLIRKKCQSILDNVGSDGGQSSEAQLKQKSEVGEVGVKNEIIVSSPSNLVQPGPQRFSGHLNPMNINDGQNRLSLQSPNAVTSEDGDSIGIVDIENNKQEDYIIEHARVKNKGHSRIANLNILNSKRQRRSSYLSNLQLSAIQGNRVSMRIWNQIEVGVRQSIQKKSPFYQP